MRKIFSLMLMATALLISGQVKAIDWASMPTTNDADYDAAVTIDDVTKYCSLTDAFAAVNSKTATIKMLKTPEQIKGSSASATRANNGTKCTFGEGTNLTWNLNGKSVDFFFYRFILNKAHVLLTGTGTLSYDAWYYSTNDYDSEDPSTFEFLEDKYPTYPSTGYHYFFQISGSASDEANVASLTIDENVVLTGFGYGFQVTGDALGVKVIVKGEVRNSWGVTVNGGVGKNGAYTGKINVPQIIVEKTGHIASGEYGAAIYGGGYALYQIYGTLTGGTGIYAKSGKYEIDGASITATGDYFPSKDYGNGFTGCGSALIFDSNSGYPGAMSLEISGETNIVATNGYAIEEVKTKGDQSNVDGIAIDGGNFQVLNSEYVCLKTTDEVRDMVRNNGTITGGIYNTDEVKNYVGKDQVITFYSNVDGEDKWTIGTIPSGETWKDNFETPNSYVQLNNKTAQLAVIHVTADQTIKYLAVLGNDQVVIDDNVTLTVGAVVVNDGASIVVSPKAALRVNEKGGLISTDAENLIIEASEEGSGTFIFNTDVKSNRNPYATVQYFARYAHAYSGGHENYMFDIMVSPFRHIDDLSYSFDDADAESAEGGAWSAYQLWQNGHWVKISSYQQLYDNARAFQPIAITNSSKASYAGVIYTFKGMLEGNNNGSMDMGAGYNYMGNAYLAPMDAPAFLEQVTEKDKLDDSFWYWDGLQQSFLPKTIDNLGSFKMGPMSFFVLHSTAKENVQFDYKKLIWDFNTK